MSDQNAAAAPANAGASGALSVKDAVAGLAGLEQTSRARSDNGQFARANADAEVGDDHEDLDEGFDDDAGDGQAGDDDDAALDADDESESEGDDSQQDEGEDDEGDKSDPTVKFKVGDDEIEVKQSELVETYREIETARAEVSQGRDQLMAVANNVKQERDGLVALTTQLAAWAEQILPTQEDVDGLMAVNIPEGIKLQNLRNKWLGELEAIKGAPAELSKRAQTAESEQLKLERAEAEKLIPQVIPEWKNPATRKSDMARMGRYMVDKLKMSRDEVATLTDPRAYAAIRKSMLWDEFQDRRAKKGKTTPQPAPKRTQRPAARPDAGRVNEAQAREAHSKTPSRKSAEAMLAAKGF